MLTNLNPEADRTLVEQWLEEFRKNNIDLTESEAWRKIEKATEKPQYPDTEIHLAIDWYTIWEKEMMMEEAQKAKATIEEIYRRGLIKPEELGLYRKHEVVVKEPKKVEALKKRLEELEAKLREKEKPKEQPSTEQGLTQQFIDQMKKEFRVALSRQNIPEKATYLLEYDLLADEAKATLSRLERREAEEKFRQMVADLIQDLLKREAAKPPKRRKEELELSPLAATYLRIIKAHKELARTTPTFPIHIGVILEAAQLTPNMTDDEIKRRLEAITGWAWSWESIRTLRETYLKKR